MPILDQYGQQFGPIPGEENVRRWETAKTSRLNSGHWGDVDDRSINRSINDSLADYRTKCLNEATNNPFISGMMHTHATDIVGPSGPIMQCQSSSSRFNKAMEREWNSWFEMPDLNGRLSGVDMMRLWIPQFWTCGEIIEQKTNDPRLLRGESLDDDEPGSRNVALRLLAVHPRRMKNPYTYDASRVMVDGVECDANGKTQKLHIVPFGSDEASGLSAITPQAFDAKGFLHCFQPLEANQVRGFPWLGPCLQTAADLRDLDIQILDGLRSAADWMVFFTCNDPNNPPQAMTGQVQSKRRMMRFLPNGYDAKSVQGNQPGVNHMEYRKTRLAELGRMVSMPGMIVELNCGDHSFSGANFDGQCYARGNAVTQTWLERVALTPLVKLVRREAAFKVAALRSVPDDWSISFTWTKPPHVDPVKAAKYLQMMLESGLFSEIEACGYLGIDYETVAANIKRAGEIRKEQGISDPLATLNAKLAAAATNPNTPAEQRMAVMIEELREWVSETIGGRQHAI